MFEGTSPKSEIVKHIDAATAKTVTSPDWGLNLEICDAINREQDGPQQAMKALRSRLQQREERIIENVLILLDTLVKNCGRRFHLQMATREFMCDMIRLVSPRDPSPQPVKDRALTLIEQCSDAFGPDKDLSAVKEAYQYLKSQNVTFPARNLDDMVAIHTPRPSHSVIDPPMRSNPPPPPAAAVAATPPPPAQPTQPPVQPPTQPATQQPPSPGYHPSGISTADLQRLNKELLVVRGNDGVMNDILTDLQHNSSPKPDELQLLRDLHGTCKEMHRRMMELLEQVEEEGLVCQLLDLIDKLNNTFIRYERYERNLTMASPPDPVTGGPLPLGAGGRQPQATTAVMEPTPSEDVDLIGLNNDEPTYATLPSATTANPLSANNPFGDMIAAPISRLPPVGPTPEGENIYTTGPAMVPVAPSSSGPVSTDEITLQPQDQFDMFAQSRGSTLSEQATIAGSEAAYDAAHDVFETGSLSSALNASRKPNLSGDDSWLRDLNTVEPSSNAMTSEEFDAFLNERAPPPPTGGLGSNGTSSEARKRPDDEDLLAL